MDNREIIQHFWDDIPENAQDIEGLIWQKENGTWIILIGNPDDGRLLECSIDYNPFNGKRLERTR